MKIISYNVNGIRAAIKKGLVQWLSQVDADVVCIQEVRATTGQFDETMLTDLGYHCTWHQAEKKGYSGVGILSKSKPRAVRPGIGEERFDSEGRLLAAEIDDITIVNAYHPSGASHPARQLFKLDWLEVFGDYSRNLLDRPAVLSGDYNICHEDIDIHNPMANRNTPGFTPVERQWFGDLLQSGLTDAFRFKNPQPEEYTWFSYMNRARERNLGWRIDYHLTTPEVSEQIKRCVILKEARHSDHCPVLLEISSS